MEQPKTPELDKIQKCHEKSQAIGEFLEWLETTSEPIYLCYLDYDNDDYYPVDQSRQIILEEYFEIDGKKAEKERQSLFDYIRALNKEQQHQKA